MKNFNCYAEKAIERHGLTGYNNLARELNMNKATLSFFRSGKALPSDDTMIKLAELAGLPKEEALIDLNLWRSKDKPEVQKIWLRLSKMIGCALTFLVFSSFAIKTCFADNKTPCSQAAFSRSNIYYATNVYLRIIYEKLRRYSLLLLKFLAKRGLNYA